MPCSGSRIGSTPEHSDKSHEAEVLWRENLGEDKEDSFDEGKGVEAFYDWSVSPSENPEIYLSRIRFSVIAYLVKLMQREKKEDASWTT